MNKLEQATQAFEKLAQSGDFEQDGVLREALALLRERRAMDLSFLAPKAQAELIRARSVDLLPSVDDLEKRIESLAKKGRALHVKLGIDPTSPDVHIGHAVPMILLSRFQRLGHEVTLIIGDITASIGDPSGRTDDRPALTAEVIASNLATYKRQVSPFFNFERARLRNNSEWLRDYRLIDLLPLLAKIPVSQSMQREDFRTRLAAGQSLTMAEQLYSVVMGLDSVALDCDVEVGGIDQLLNMQMCRTLMAVSGQAPELVCTVPLIEGTDGSGTKMSKSRGNYVAMSDPPGEIFGKIMSIPDRLTVDYFKALTELADSEVTLLHERVPPQNVKQLLAATLVDTVHGLDAALEARRSFLARFRNKKLSDASDLPTVTIDARTLGAVLKDLEFAPSLSQVRRVADQNGLELVIEVDGEVVEKLKLARADLDQTIDKLLLRTTHSAAASAIFLRMGRKAARLKAS